MTAPPVALPEWLSADELEALARDRLPASVYDYVAGGAGEELTLAANRDAFARLRLRPRVLTGAAKSSTRASFFGAPVAAPLFVCPMGEPSHRLVHESGVAGMASGAAAAGVAYMLSASSASTLDIAGDARVAQVYLVDRDETARLVSLAEELGYVAVCVTADVPVAALRRRNLRHGVASPAPAGERTRQGFANPAAYARPASWEDFAWLRARTLLPVLVKGIMTGEDAALAAEAGAGGVVVSNHGGRQLDHALGTIEVLPEVIAAVAGRCPVLLDGGVRTATDVALALSLGASAVGVGKSAMWALAAGGPQAVTNFLTALIADLARTLALLGVSAPGDLTPAFVDTRHARYPDWHVHVDAGISRPGKPGSARGSGVRTARLGR